MRYEKCIRKFNWKPRSKRPLRIQRRTWRIKEIIVETSDTVWIASHPSHSPTKISCDTIIKLRILWDAANIFASSRIRNHGGCSTLKSSTLRKIKLRLKSRKRPAKISVPSTVILGYYQ